MRTRAQNGETEHEDACSPSAGISRREVLKVGAGAVIGGATASLLPWERRATASTPPRAAQAPEELFRELDTKIEAGMARYRIPGVAIGVLYQGDEYVRGYGVTNVDEPQPVDGDTLFRIASTTKTFTGTAVMRLVEQGVLDLSAPVRRYLPEFRVADEAASAQVTLRECLNHSAGWVGDDERDFGRGDDSLARYIASMRELPQLTPPGAQFAYSNTAIDTAGRVIEVVTGQPYEEAVRDLLLDPLDRVERIEQQIPHRLLVRLAGDHLDDAASSVNCRTAVGELRARWRELRQLAHAGDVPGQRIVTTTEVPFVVPNPTGAVVETLAQRDLRGGFLVRHAEFGQVAADGGTQVEYALLDQPHDDRARKRLGRRGDAKEGVAVDRLGLVDVGDAIAAHVLLALVEHADGDAGDVVPGHTGLDLGVQLAEEVLGRLRALAVRRMQLARLPRDRSDEAVAPRAAPTPALSAPRREIPC